MIVFENKGLLDLQLITTFGASVKEGKNPIGQFGTGLKYALAVLLRNKQSVMLVVGGQRYTFGLKASNIRGKDFALVRMTKWPAEAEQMPATVEEWEGAEETLCGFTTELGKHWEMWMAYRELACNVMDEEGGKVYEVEPGWEVDFTGKTFFCVNGEAITQCYRDRKDYILEGEPYFKQVGGQDIQACMQTSKAVYYRGIKVHELEKTAIVQWNFIREMTLTEDRTLSHSWMVTHHLEGALLVSENRELLMRVLTASHKDTLEGGFSFTGRTQEPSKVFLEVTEFLYNQDQTRVNQTAVAVLRAKQKAAFRPKPQLLSRVQQGMLARATAFVKSLGYDLDKYPIKVVEELGTNILGQAIDGTIYVAVKVMHTGGTKMLAATLLEEFIHLEYKVADESREMQQVLFDKIISMGEETKGEPL